jgi:hypothetical protein
MIYDILKILSTSIYSDEHELLFSIIEEFLAPIRFASMQECIEKQAEFSGLLTYSGYEIQK